MKLINARLLTGEVATIEVEGAKISRVIDQHGLVSATGVPKIDSLGDLSGTQDSVVDCGGQLVLPAAIDVHVHSRDPGLTHKEDWFTLALGAYKGGVVAVCDMPNTIPPTMDRAAIEQKAERARQSGLEFRFYLGVGIGNIDRLQELLDDPALPLCGIKVYYGQSTGELMYDDLEHLARVVRPDISGVLSFHSEDQCTIDCNMTAHGTLPVDPSRPESFIAHSEIRSSASAWASTKAILDWAIRHRRHIHIAHISTPREVDMLIEARKAGLRVSSEVAPHHLLFSVDDYRRLGPFLKMNPPVRSTAERDELLRQFGRGEIDFFATDHAPHTLAEKRAEYGKCPSGVPSIEYFWPLLLELASKANLSGAKTLAMASSGPAAAFGFRNLGLISGGYDASLVWMKEEANFIEQKQTVSKCGWTPYDGLALRYKVGATWHKGKKVYPR